MLAALEPADALRGREQLAERPDPRPWPLLDAAESLARESGHRRIGRTVDVASTRARARHERRGSADAGLGTFVVRGSWVDRDGSPRVFAETCTYLIRTLA